MKKSSMVWVLTWVLAFAAGASFNLFLVAATLLCVSLAVQLKEKETKQALQQK